MDDVQRQLDERHFIEDFGLYTEQLGFPRMAGRILGWLLICDPSHQSAGQLGEMLGASKGSVSAMTRLLIQMNLVERVALPDHRRDYYRLRSGAWPQLIKSELAVMTGLHQMVERGLAMTAGRDAAYQKRLREAHDLYAFLERELPMLLERWEHERKSINSR